MEPGPGASGTSGTLIAVVLLALAIGGVALLVYAWMHRRGSTGDPSAGGTPTGGDSSAPPA